MKRKNIGFGFILFLLVVAGMIFTNPGMDEFQRFVAREVSTQFSTDNADVITQLGSSFAGEIAAGVVEKFTLRKNFLCCSIYTVSIPGKEWNYLGMFHFFVPMQKDSPLDFIPSDQ